MLKRQKLFLGRVCKAVVKSFNDPRSIFLEMNKYFMNNQLISVINTTKNEEKNIANYLESIKKQTYPQELIEIIVVDNNSEDKTKEISESFLVE
jgi:cellulose synthase/poly-beta-1,6-N-acetylglucosamine synthase-like glycosyltransferase